jgi:hypothetical protein
MNTQHYTTANRTTAREVVLSLVGYLNDHDYKRAKEFAHPDMQFVGVMGSRDGADAYFKDMEKMQLEYNIKKVFADGNDVCIFSDLLIDNKTIFCSSWYHVEDDKVKSLKVVFDPRPLI